MRPLRTLLFAFLTAAALSAQDGNADAPEGLSILQQMSDHYAAATSWYIEATKELTSENEYSRFWTKDVMIAAVSGNKFHYEGHSANGYALHISDGKTAWLLHPEEKAYTEEPIAATSHTQKMIWQGSETALMRAEDLRKALAEFAGHYNAATRLPDETITLGGIAIPCYVVGVTPEQRKGPKSEALSLDETLWIDKAMWAVRKTVEHQKGVAYRGGARISWANDVVTTYTRAQLNSAVPEALFHFQPPADAMMVANFDTRPFGPDLTGVTAPDVQLVSADGKRVPLSSYRGKPVLLDFWATWCAPCVGSMPKLAKLHEEATPKGLVMLSVDEDEDENAATDFLAKNHYIWPNTHDDTGKIGDAFKKNGIPLFVLIDPRGKIVFYGSSGDEGELRNAVASLGPEFASLAPTQTRPCQVTEKSN